MIFIFINVSYCTSSASRSVVWGAPWGSPAPALLAALATTRKLFHENIFMKNIKIVILFIFVDISKIWKYNNINVIFI